MEHYEAPEGPCLILGDGHKGRTSMMYRTASLGGSHDVFVDMDPEKEPDLLFDLNRVELPFNDNHFAVIRAEQILEHLGHQGDYHFFFRQWNEFWRLLKPGGLFIGAVPSYASEWAWGDPGHKRVITNGTLVFLSQKEYEKQVGVTPMTDYRSVYWGDFELLGSEYDEHNFYFVLRAVK